MGLSKQAITIANVAKYKLAREARLAMKAARIANLAKKPVSTEQPPATPKIATKATKHIRTEARRPRSPNRGNCPTTPPRHTEKVKKSPAPKNNVANAKTNSNVFANTNNVFAKTDKTVSRKDDMKLCGGPAQVFDLIPVTKPEGFGKYEPEPKPWIHKPRVEATANIANNTTSNNIRQFGDAADLPSWTPVLDEWSKSLEKSLNPEKAAQDEEDSIFLKSLTLEEWARVTEEIEKVMANPGPKEVLAYARMIAKDRMDVC